MQPTRAVAVARPNLAYNGSPSAGQRCMGSPGHADNRGPAAAGCCLQAEGPSSCVMMIARPISEL